ncbi:MAG: hypothetical protein JXB32_20080 [Deltaproteobacteria bacterium]|nr:hypothetical protein [Deltaproteobacteria bacterium]
MELAALVTAADDIEQALAGLAAAPGVPAAAAAELARRRPHAERPAPWSTVVLVRLAGHPGDATALSAVIPFLADANPRVQVEAAEALEAAPLGELRTALDRLSRQQPAAAWWEAVVTLLEARDEVGVGRMLVDLCERLSAPAALAAALEALPWVAEPAERSLVRRTVERFCGDTRAVPDAETDEGPVTLALVAAEVLEQLRGGDGGRRDGGD